MRQPVRIAMLGLLAALLLAAPAAAQELQSTVTTDVDPRWLPWLGCWELVGDAVGNQEVESTGQRLVCVTGRADGKGVGIGTWVDGVQVLEETVIADGERRPLERNGCSGWELARWSADGHRLFLESEESCGEAAPRSFAGLTLMASGNVWVDVQAVNVAGGQHREVMVQRYRRAGGEAAASIGVTGLSQGQAIAAATARAAASEPLDIDDVVEAATVLPSEALEAALLERGAGFALGAEELLRLADAGLEDSVIDLMVALSYPDRFIVDSGAVEEMEDRSRYHGRTVSGYRYGGYYYGYYPYASYAWDPFFAPFGYGYRFAPRRNIRVVPRVADTGSLFGGKVIQGRGYARIRSRDTGNGGGGFFGNLRDGGRGITDGRPGRGSGIGSAGGGAGGGGAVTPQGHTGGGGSKRKAKPRGGGSGSGSGSGH